MEVKKLSRLSSITPQEWLLWQKVSAQVVFVAQRINFAQPLKDNQEMAEVIRMPKMSDTMTEGVIVAWNKKVCDTVAPGAILAEVETDKATMELESYVKGVLLHIGIGEGDAVPVDAVIAVVGKEGEDIDAILKEAASESKAQDEPAEE